MASIPNEQQQTTRPATCPGAAEHPDSTITSARIGSSDITAKAQDAPMGLMTGAWEVPLPKPISSAAFATHAGLHRVSPSTESIRRP